MENAHEDVTDLQCNRTNERKPAMRVENMPKPANTPQIRFRCKPRIRNVSRQNSLLVTHMLTIAHRNEDRTS